MNYELLEKIIIERLPVRNKEILQRRINKLKNDPMGFLESSYKKRSAQIISKTPIKHKGGNDFTVVSAVYNVEKYLDDYFKSLINQSLSFKKHIQLILVDDGSTDSSAIIIKKWQKKYPKNITYIYKKNEGQASARNLGIKKSKTEWITFIDADDFVDSNYFLIVDAYITKSSNSYLIMTNILQYDDNGILFNDAHPLRKKFYHKSKTIKINKEENYIQEAVSGVFVRKSLIINKDIYFNERLKPILEDSEFISRYLIINRDGNMGFLKEAIYFHRKNDKYKLNLDWDNYEDFNLVFNRSLLDICYLADKEIGYVPLYIQNIMIYNLSCLVSQVVDNKEVMSFLDEQEKYKFLNTIDSISKYIDTENIINYSFSNSLFYYKIGILGAFKKESIDPSLQVSYIDSYDHKKNLFRVRFFSNIKNEFFSFQFDGTEVPISYSKVIRHEFLERSFAYEYILWLKIPKNGVVLNFYVSNKLSKIAMGGKKYQGLKEKSLSNFFKIQELKDDAEDEKWFFIDSDFKADDNAEHLYRYVINNTDMDIRNLYFGLNSDSHDWNRLEYEGFNLVDMKKDSSIDYMRSSDKIISSNASDYIMSFDGKDSLLNKYFIFLQHGVIHNDLSKWLKSKRIDLFLTTTYDEYESIASDKANYFFTDKEVKLIGQPRYDSLLTNNNPNKQILIMPTWRKDIVGKLLGAKTALREFNPSFMDSEYANRWQSLLLNPQLKKISEEFGYEVIYFPHANVQIYNQLFEIPEYISIVTHETGSIQELFQKAELMITDYSSVAFEMAYLNKQVIYYQFDEQSFLSGSHTSKPSYFSYRKHGFGPVVVEESEVLIELTKVLANNGKPLKAYATRMQDTFAYHDTNNCQRVYKAIIDLDCPVTSEASFDTMMSYAQQAINHEAWDLSLQRMNNALKHSDITQAQIDNITQLKEKVIYTGYQDQPVKLANILWQEKRLSEALEQLKQADITMVTDELLRLRVKLAILNNNFILARDSQKLLLEEYAEACTIEDWQFYTQLATI